ncbi:MAG TPA: LuxR C-terminal-related transcriptional regulator, partial [Streptosporangiaceae bacterium]|nr:LuxR C-terminal-related transcriptional regulator [Streptosporangiaceae bacterium]
ESLLSCDGELSIELPESLRDLLIDRVQALPDLTQDVLRAASCGAGVTSHTLLSKVTGLDDQALTDALRPAVIANVLRAEAAGYRFGHELIREAVHDDLLPGEHGRLHIKFAEAIDADNAIVPPGRAAIEMAFHWNSGHDATWALIASWQAAAQAGRAVAPAERLDLLARVLELWDQVPDAAERIGADHGQVLEEATAAAEDAGEYSRGVAFATSALAELDADTEPVRAALLYAARARYRLASERIGYTEDFWEAVRLVPAVRDPKARLKILLGAEHCAPDARALRACSEEALDLARQIGDQAAQARAMLMLAMFEADEGQQAEPGSGPIEQIRQARALAAQAGADQVLLRAAVDESHLLEGAGQHELAYAVARDGLAAVAAHRVPRKDGSVLVINQAEPLFFLGRWDETVSLADEALDVYVAPVPGHRALVQVLKGQVATARGDLAGAARAAATAKALLRTPAGATAGSAAGTAAQQDALPLAQLRILLATAEDSTLHAAVETSTQILDSQDLATANPRYTWPVVSTAADLCVSAARQAAGSQDEAFAGQIAMLADRLRTVAEKIEVFGPLQRAHQATFSAADAATRKLLGADEETDEEIRAAWDTAAEAWAALSQPYDEARALFRAAEAALADGGRDTATDRLRRAAPLTAQLGAAPLGAQIGILARRARIWLGDGATHGSGMEAGGLTEREIEVLRLVAAGHSNKEIAAELFISPKTASVHVSNILGKLNATTRTEAAARAHSLRLLG